MELESISSPPKAAVPEGAATVDVSEASPRASEEAVAEPEEPISAPEELVAAPEASSEAPEVTTPAVDSVPPPAAAAATADGDLRLAALQAIQAELYADDVPIDLELMAGWTSPQVRRYFESGGLEQPDAPVEEAAPAAPEAAPIEEAAPDADAELPPPASPAQELITADEPDTPATVEF